MLRRCGACERWGLQWPCALYLFKLDALDRPRAGNLLALCGPCSEGVLGHFAPLLADPPLRERLWARNNRWTGAAKLTAARRRRLIVERARGARPAADPVPAPPQRAPAGGAPG